MGLTAGLLDHLWVERSELATVKLQRYHLACNANFQCGSYQLYTETQIFSHNLSGFKDPRPRMLIKYSILSASVATEN